MKRKVTGGLTSVSLPIFIQDTSSTNGGGLSGVTFGSSGLVIEYRRHGQSTWTSVTPVTKTLGTYVSGGIVVNGALAGRYELDLPDAAFASGVRFVEACVRGVTNMFPVLIEIELDAVNYQDGVRFGLTALPNVVIGSAGALLTSGTGAAQLATSSGLVTLAGVTHTGAVIPTVSDVTTKTGYSLSTGGILAIWDALTSALTTVGSIGKLFVDNINATISSRSTYAGGDTTGTTTLLSRIASALTITAGNVTVGINNDKTGYSLLATTGLGNQTSNITGNLSGAVGSVTGNVGGNVVGSVASVTSAIVLPTIPTNWITAAGIAASSLNGKGDWNIGKTGYALSQGFPANFASMAITVGGSVTVGTNSDKTGYSLVPTTGLGNQTANITGNLSGSVGLVVGAVGSVTGLVVGNLDATISSRASATNLATVASYIDGKPTLAQIEASTVLAKEATVSTVPGLVWSQLTTSTWPTDSFGKQVVIGASTQRAITISGLGSGHVACVVHDAEPNSIPEDAFVTGALSARALSADAATEIATAVASIQVLSRLDSMIESNGEGQFRFDMIALSLAPSGSGGGGGGDPWSTLLPGSYAIGTAGYLFSSIKTEVNKIPRCDIEVIGGQEVNWLNDQNETLKVRYNG